MKYIYSVVNDKATLVSRINDNESIITSEILPARVEKPGYKAILKYDEAQGVYWDYVPYTPEELRENEYITNKCVTYEGKTMTVDEANTLWIKYQAENNAKAAELTTLIAAAKATPIKRLSPNAAGTMISKYRHREIIREGIPMPKPSNAPEETMDMEDTINPALIMRRAAAPI